MTDAVNDSLGLAHFLTHHRGEEATLDLLAIEGISIDEWRASKELLPSAYCTTDQ